MTGTLDFDDVDQLVQLLEDAGLVADVDPAKLRLPGVWVRVDGISLESLDGCTINTSLIVIAPDVDVRRAMTQLQAPFNKLVDLLAGLGGPTGDTTTATVALPDGAGNKPALVVPFDLLTTPDEE